MNSHKRVLSFPGSTAIDKATYNIMTNELEIRFPRTRKRTDGSFLASTWMFMGVPAREFADFAIATSPGRHFNDKIRTTYPSTRMNPPPEAPST
jgi:hypothetical protein